MLAFAVPFLNPLVHAALDKEFEERAVSCRRSAEEWYIAFQRSEMVGQTHPPPDFLPPTIFILNPAIKRLIRATSTTSSVIRPEQLDDLAESLRTAMYSDAEEIVIQLWNALVTTNNPGTPLVPAILGHSMTNQDFADLLKPLLFATSAWTCNASDCDGNVHWLSSAISHVQHVHDGFADTMVGVPKPLLVKIVKDMKLDPMTARLRDVGDSKTLLCDRCPPELADYKSLEEMVSIYRIRLAIVSYHFFTTGQSLLGASGMGYVSACRSRGLRTVADHDHQISKPLVSYHPDGRSLEHLNRLSAFKIKCDMEATSAGKSDYYCGLCPPAYAPKVCFAFSQFGWKDSAES